MQFWRQRWRDIKQLNYISASAGLHTHTHTRGSRLQSQIQIKFWKQTNTEGQTKCWNCSCSIKMIGIHSVHTTINSIVKVHCTHPLCLIFLISLHIFFTFFFTFFHFFLAFWLLVVEVCFFFFVALLMNNILFRKKMYRHCIHLSCGFLLMNSL